MVTIATSKTPSLAGAHLLRADLPDGAPIE